MNPLISQFGKEKRWVNWKFETKKKEQTKIPYQAKGATHPGRKALSTDETTWSIHEEAIVTSDKIGIVLTPDQKLLGIDIDHCVEEGVIVHPEQDKIRNFLVAADTYTEISPSKSGLHSYLALTSPLTLKIHKRKPFEIYNSGRYFTVTGDVFENERGVRMVTPEEALKLLSLIGYPWTKEVTSLSCNVESSLGDSTLLEKMFSSKKNGAKVRSLYGGDTSSYDHDDSSADMALCMYFAFYTQKDALQMERLWLASPLGAREKTQKRKDYRDRTINAAIEKCTEVYKPLRQGKYLKTEERSALGLDLHMRDRLAEVISKSKDQRNLDATLLSIYAFTFREENINLKVSPEGQFYDYENGVYRPQADRMMRNRIYRSLDNRQMAYMAGVNHVSKIFNNLNAHVPLMPESDTDQHIINVSNGLLDLRSMTLSPHTPDHISTAQSPAAYVPNAACPRWQQFLDDVSKKDQELIDYLQEVVGYCALTNDTSHHAAFFIYGPGGNGKGTFTRVIESLVDSNLLYHATVEQITGRFGGAMLIDKRLVILDEPNIKEFKSEVFRKYVSGEPSFAEKKGVTDMIPFKPRARFICTTNEPPRYDEANDANSRRFHLIPFTNKFEGEKIIRNLADLIIAEERDGILLWAIEGLKRLQARGIFSRPAIVRKEQKIVGRYNSSVQSFFYENFEVSMIEAFCTEMKKDEMYALYRTFCDRNGYSPKACSRFIQDMKLIAHIKYQTKDDSVLAFSNLTPLEPLSELQELRNSTSTYPSRRHSWKQ